MRDRWRVAWFSSVRSQIFFVNALNPMRPTDIQFIYNPWRFWAPYGAYFCSPALNEVGHGAELLIKQLAPSAKGLEFPKKAGDCGYDLVVNQEAILGVNVPHPTDIPCDFAMKIPDTYFGLIINRSSAEKKFGIRIVPSIIDSGYTGPIHVGSCNMTSAPVFVPKGARLAQLILLPIFTPQLRYVDELPKTKRGSSGFGSTGLL